MIKDGPMFGYDWPRLHAALNDLPAALLPLAVLFDLAGTLFKRDSFKTVGFWALLVGVAGTGAAVFAGLRAEDVIDHSDEAHAVMEVHKTAGLAVLGLFAALAAWRVIRHAKWRMPEKSLALLIGTAGAGLLIYTAQLGGSLTFDHALGVPTTRLHEVIEQRGGEDHMHGGPLDGMTAPGDSAAAGDSTAPAAGRTHTHRDGTTETHPR